MSEKLFDLLMQCDISTLIIIAAAFFFYDKRMQKRFDKIDAKFDKVFEELKELRTSLNRMEGAFYSKDCCILKEDKQNKKVE